MPFWMSILGYSGDTASRPIRGERVIRGCVGILSGSTKSTEHPSRTGRGINVCLYLYQFVILMRPAPSENVHKPEWELPEGAIMTMKSGCWEVEAYPNLLLMM